MARLLSLVPCFQQHYEQAFTFPTEAPSSLELPESGVLELTFASNRPVQPPAWKKKHVKAALQQAIMTTENEAPTHDKNTRWLVSYHGGAWYHVEIKIPVACTEDMLSRKRIVSYHLIVREEGQPANTNEPKNQGRLCVREGPTKKKMTRIRSELLLLS